MSQKFLRDFKLAIQYAGEDKISRLGAALAYYSIFSLAPLLIVAIGIASLIFGEDASRGEIEHSLQGLVGRPGAQTIQLLMKNAAHQRSGVIATVVGLVTLLVGASGIFYELQDALNTIWKVAQAKTSGVKAFIKQRTISFLMVLGIGLLLLASMAASAILSVISTFFSHLLPGGSSIWHLVDFFASFGVMTFLFGMIFKILPDAPVSWRNVWTGSVLTAILFSTGKLLIGLYLGSSSISSVYGATGSIVILLLWVYYSSQIVLFGAEFTRAHAQTSGMESEKPLSVITQNKSPYAA